MLCFGQTLKLFIFLDSLPFPLYRNKGYLNLPITLTWCALFDCILTLMTSKGLTMIASVTPEARPANMKVLKYKEVSLKIALLGTSILKNKKFENLKHIQANENSTLAH